MEANFDGLVGPTHNYAGLSFGNVASTSNKQAISHPKEAALQGLEKMKFLHQLGLVQGVIPPQERPYLPALRKRGYSGSDPEVLAKVAKEDPLLLAHVSSASSMWTANAATVSPSPDTQDEKLHFTPANLLQNFHRSLEPAGTSRILRAIFPDPSYFVHHAPLPAEAKWGDEGAANHTRLCREYESEGLEIFVYGCQDSARDKGPKKFPARQTLEASQRIAHQHGVKQAVFLQQNPAVIDQGVFHNDVIAVGNRQLLFFHEEAFAQDPRPQIDATLKDQWEPLMVPTKQVSVSDAVKSYLFNSQLIFNSAGETWLISPQECQETESVFHYLQENTGPRKSIRGVHFLNLRQSMRNGGGPACLRLRVVLNTKEQAAVNPACLFNLELYRKLKQWVEKHYRADLHPKDLADPQLLRESREALDELSNLLKLGSVYEFQSN